MSVFKPSNVALITGGASGIGLAIAKLCLAREMSVAIVDRNKDTLNSSSEALRSKFPGSKLEVFEADVGSQEAWSSVRSSFLNKFQKLDLLVLNAGMGIQSDWTDAQAFRTVFDTNFFGYVNGVAALLDLVNPSDCPKSIVLTGSKQGITNPPSRPAYNASKAAVKVYAEQLHYDLRNSSTSVHLLVPGWTFTGLSEGKEKPAGAWAPEQVADYLLEKMQKDQFYIICPDNEDEETDKRRMLWSVGDIVENRPPLSRWREDWKEKAAEALQKERIR